MKAVLQRNVRAGAWTDEPPADGRGPGAPRGRAPEPRGGGAIIDVEGRDVTAETDESGPDRLGDGS